MKHFLVATLSGILLIACSAKKNATAAESTKLPVSQSETVVKLGEIVTLPSGLKYKVIKEGIGKSPKMNDKVRAHYHGTLEDGTVFDSSYDRGEPLTFTLNQVIKGWQEGLQLMKEGAIWELYIPPNLGYGSRPAGKIPPFSNLTFKVELLEVL